MGYNEHITQWHTVAVSPGCPPRQINNLEDVSSTISLLDCSSAPNVRKWEASHYTSVSKAPIISLRECLMADLMGYNKAQWSLDGARFRLFVEWLTDNVNKTVHMCTAPWGWGHWASLTFPSMIITGQRCLLGERRGGSHANLLNLRASHVRWVTIISLIGSK